MIDMLLLATQLYTVKPGDNLWNLVGTKWPAVCEVNRLENCDLIYPNEKLNLDPPAHITSSIVGRHRFNDGDSDSDDGYIPRHSSGYTSRHSNGAIVGNLGCNGLESLWIDNGGAKNEAFIAAEIAMAESGGRQYATGPVGERGYWQIHPDHGPQLSTYNANGNARAAIEISGNGTNWSPWTTYVDGAYAGRC